VCVCIYKIYVHDIYDFIHASDPHVIAKYHHETNDDSSISHCFPEITMMFYNKSYFMIYQSVKKIFLRCLTISFMISCG